MRLPPALTRAAVLVLSINIVTRSVPPGFAADPQPYKVDLKPTGNAALDGALHDLSMLISLQKDAPVGGFGLVTRARQDETRFETALHSFGYYKGKVTITIEGKPINDPALPDVIAAAPADPPLPVDVAFDLGPQFQLGRVAVNGALPEDARAKLGLEPGAPAQAADVLAAQQRLLTALRDQGYPLAKVNLPPAVLHPAENTLDVTLDVQTGPRTNIGEITIKGLQDMNELFVRQRLLIHPGDQFSAAAIEKARQDLASIGVFSVVRIDPADCLAPDGTLPLTVDVTERPKHAVDFGIAYSTDLGINFNAGWHDRNLFGNAEQLNITGEVLLGGNALTKPGYTLGTQFIKPDFLARDQSLEIDVNAFKQSLQAYDQRGLSEKIAINRKVFEHWTLSAGVSAEQEQVTQEGIRRNYNLIGLPLNARYDTSDSLLNPTTGIRANFSVTPTESLGTPNSTFVTMQAAGSTYLDFGTGGQSVLALRGLAGHISGTGVFGIPPDQRFYAGGSGTVRGYRYQTLGPQFPDRKPTGGTSITTGTVEFRQRFFGNYGAVAFVDAGQVTASGSPFNNGRGWHAGAGVGFRSYTPIGPIRLDVAFPLNRLPGGDAFELYIGIGQAF